MYNLGAVPLGYFKSYYPQTAVITFTKGSTTETITEANIMSGGLMVNRYSVSGKKIEIGSTIAAELNLKLDNRNGDYDSFSFEGGEMFVQIGIRKNATSTQYYVPLGYFTVDETPQKRSIINITALDRMTLFDVEANAALFTANMTVANYINTCCTACGVTLYTTLSNLPNYNYTITEFPDYGLTYRQILQWCAAILGTCAYMDWNGQLRLEWFSDNNTGFTINQGDRYNSEIEENDITISGVHLDADDGSEYLAGTNDYVIDLADNFLIQHDHQSVVSAIYGKIGGFSYRPFRCEMKPAPHLYPLDKIVFVDKQGVNHNTIITDYTFKMNGHTFVEGKGETLTTNTYDIPDLTPQAMAMLNREVSRATAAEGVLSSRITQNESEISAKVSKTGGSQSSFAWSLTSSGFTLYSNGEEVMKVTDSMAGFAGTIIANSGIIGSWYISYDSDDDADYLRSANGVYAKYSYKRGMAQVVYYVTGWAFMALTPTGLMYIVKDSPYYDTGTTLAKIESMNLLGREYASSGGSSF